MISCILNGESAHQFEIMVLAQFWTVGNGVFIQQICPLYIGERTVHLVVGMFVAEPRTGIEEHLFFLADSVVTPCNPQYEIVENLPFQIGICNEVVGGKRIILIVDGHQRIHAVVRIGIGLVIEFRIQQILSANT